MQRYVIIVTGKVQGVFFRDTARKVALGLGLTGLIRNEPNGSVYIEAEGDESSLKKFLSWCHAGPAQAKVTTVTSTKQTPTGHKGFQIR